VHQRHLPAVKPLTARSVAISTLLGYHPPELPVRALVRVGGLFGIPERTTRVALTRMVADRDVLADNGIYRLTERLVRRQAAQEDACSPVSQDWDGCWEMAVVTGAARPLADRVALRKSMIRLRLAELREGTWLRPNNLPRDIDGSVAGQCWLFESRFADSRGLVEQLWDLRGWAEDARELLARLSTSNGLADEFMLIAEMVRHLLIDPILPPRLCPAGWPSAELHARYAEFSAGYAARLREYAQGEYGPG
jgi:phenylacetic acid degradation operon negative regulatory protein